MPSTGGGGGGGGGGADKKWNVPITDSIAQSEELKMERYTERIQDGEVRSTQKEFINSRLRGIL